MKMRRGAVPKESAALRKKATRSPPGGERKNDEAELCFSFAALIADKSQRESKLLENKCNLKG